MTDERMKLLMQEALDDNLTPELRYQLTKFLERDRSASRQFGQLKQVDKVLQNAPFERAPARLAMSIMARLAEEVKTQAQQSPELSSLAVALGLALVTTVMMPMLMAASWLVVNSLANPAVLTEMIQQTVALLIVLIRTMQTLLEEAERYAASDPERAMAVLSLVPMTMLSFVHYMEEYFNDAAAVV